MKNSVVKTLKDVFSNPRYVFLAAIVSVIVFVVTIWLQNIQLIGQVLGSSSLTVYSKIKFLITLLLGILTNFSGFTATYFIVIAILFGINLTLMSYYLQKRKTLNQKSMLASVGGMLSGLFGIGCAACGSFILAGLLPLVGIGFLAYLPLKGGEFGLLGIGLLLVSSYLLSKSIQQPVVCEI